jgi:hypothetical protein
VKVYISAAPYTSQAGLYQHTEGHGQRGERFVSLENLDTASGKKNKFTRTNEI